MQFGAQPPMPVAGYPNGFLPDPRHLYGGMPGPPLPHSLPHPYYPPWNGVPGVPVPGSPPGAFRPTPDGWYIPPNPRPPLPPIHLGTDPYSAIAPAAATASKPIPPRETWVHDFWKGRFAPFPGAASPPSLLGKTLKFRVSYKCFGGFADSDTI